VRPALERVQLSRLDRRVTLAAGLALLASLAVWWQARRELDAVRRELQAVTAANLFLKKTLGDMTIAITAKDKETDRLGHSPCNGQEKARPDSERRTGTRPPAYKNAMVLTPDISNRFRHRKFLHATLSSSSTM
jgi:hypothetical protein